MSPLAKPRADGTEAGSSNALNRDQELYMADGVEDPRATPCSARVALCRLSSEVQLLVREHGERLSQRLEAWTQRLEDANSRQRDMHIPQRNPTLSESASLLPGLPSATSVEPSRDPQDVSLDFVIGPNSAAAPIAAEVVHGSAIVPTTSEADLGITLKEPRTEISESMIASSDVEEPEVTRTVVTPTSALSSSWSGKLSPGPQLNQVGQLPQSSTSSAVLPGIIATTSIEDPSSCMRCPTSKVFENLNILPGTSNPSLDSTKTNLEQEPSPTETKQVSKKVREEIMRNLHKSKTKKFKHDRKHADDYFLPFAREAAEQYESCLERVVTSLPYEWLSIALIMANSTLIGIQTWLHSRDTIEAVTTGRKPEEGESSEFQVAHIVFFFVFSMDLLLRWYVDGLVEFFQTKDWAWNIFDTVIILCHGIEVILDLTGKKKSIGGFSSLRTLRIIRMVRVFRVLRVLSFFRELRMMLHSLMGCLKALTWAVLVFLLIFYVFGVVFTMGTYDLSCKRSDMHTDQEKEEFEAVIQAFGTLDRSFMSLFMGITGGKDWGEFYDVLVALPGIYRDVYVIFIIFSVLGALNVVSGVFVDNAMRNSEKDKEFAIQDELNCKEKYMHEMRSLFEEMDTSNSGVLHLEGFKQHLDDDRAVAYFSALDLDFEQAEQLFMLLDVDKSGAVDFEEFLDGCEKLKGEARSIDLAMMHYEMRWLTHGVLEFRDVLSECADKLREASQVSLPNSG